MNLTRTELEVIRALSEGFTKREIAESRHRSVDTIKTHVRHCIDKLHARNSVNLVSIAKDLGLIMLLVAVLCSAFADLDLDQRRFRLVRSFSVRGGRIEVLSV